MTAILETRSLSYSYGDGTKALDEVSISLEEARKIALVGPNGAGKSTLMLMFNGILRPDAGEVLFHGQALQYNSSSLRELRRRVGMVFQNSDDQLFAPTVYQDVAFGPVNLGFSKDKVKNYVGYALQYVGLTGYERRPPHHLSGGEKKRVSIAGILSMEPEVLILDEPTSNLDPASAEEIMEMLDELNCGRKTIIVSTHDVDLAYRWADEIILMESGGVLRKGVGPEIFSDVQLIKKARLKLPIVVDLYKELTSRGLIHSTDPPKSILELTDILDSLIRGAGAQKGAQKVPGRIYIIDVDDMDSQEIRSRLERLHISYTGAMGTNAKILAESARIPLDFTYGVIDKCILKALIGKDSLIMTSFGMTEHSIKRIKDYCQESGARIEIVKLTTSQRSDLGSEGEKAATQSDPAKPAEAQ